MFQGRLGVFNLKSPMFNSHKLEMENYSKMDCYVARLFQDCGILICILKTGTSGLVILEFLWVVGAKI